MSGRGRGRGRGGGGGQREKYPFEIDPNLENDIQAFATDNGIKDSKESDSASLFPPYPGGVPRAPPLTKREKARVALQREIIQARHNDPMAYFGPPGTMEREFGKNGKKRSAAASFDAFADQPTYAKKFQKDDFRFPRDEEFKKYPWAAPHLMPKVLWDVMGYDPKQVSDPNAPPRKAALPLKKLDKLARFDENADEGAADNAGGNDDEKPDGEEGEEAAEQQDDDFEEDEDEGDDYNAEQYFDGGDDDVDEGGGDDGYDDGY